jgi:actin-related protein
METLVFDVGSLNFRCGYSSGDQMEVRPTHRIGSLEQCQPPDYDHLQELLSSTFSDIHSDEMSILYSIKDQLSMDQKKLLITTFFEGFNVPSFYMLNQSASILYGLGLITGHSIDLGCSDSSIAPFDSGKSLDNLAQNLEFTGNYLDSSVSSSMPDYFRSIWKKYPYDRHKVKQDLLYLSSDYDQNWTEFEKDPTIFGKSYQFSRDDYINLSEERFKVPEIAYLRFYSDITEVISKRKISDYVT